MSTASGLESGRGRTQQDYVAFWNDGAERRASSVRVVFPPHEPPRGSVLEELIISALRVDHADAPTVNLHGAISLYGADREIVVGDGRVGSAEFLGDGWRVHL